MSRFLERWSKRKAEARLDEELAEPVVPEPELEPEVAPEPEPVSDPEIEAKLAALPSLDEITAATDLRPFLQDFVPRALKNAAMRKVWALDPVISTHLDVARDYAWEFNSGPLPVGFSDSLGADAIKRGLDALQVAPLPDAEAAESLSEPGERMHNISAHQESDLANDAIPATESTISDGEQPLAPENQAIGVKPKIQFALKKHGGALPD